MNDQSICEKHKSCVVVFLYDYRYGRSKDCPLCGELSDKEEEAEKANKRIEELETKLWETESKLENKSE